MDMYLCNYHSTCKKWGQYQENTPKPGGNLAASAPFFFCSPYRHPGQRARLAQAIPSLWSCWRTSKVGGSQLHRDLSIVLTSAYYCS